MYWTICKAAALTWVLGIVVGSLYMLFDIPWLLDDFWFTLVPPFVIASLLGIWLTAGMGPIWLRLLGMAAGLSILILIKSQTSHGDPASFTPGLAAATGSTALAMLGLGCLGSVLPIQSTWNVRIALWEIVVSIGLIGVTLAVVRILAELFPWDWPSWAMQAGVHYLVFSLFTGLLITITLMPLVVRGYAPRAFSIILLLVALLIVPPIESWTFEQLDLDGGRVDLFYSAHAGQTVMALAIMVPLIFFFPGVLVRQTSFTADPIAKPVVKKEPLETETDFADMQ